MEGLKKRVYVIAGILAVAGVIMLATKPKDIKRRTEAELISLAPVKVGKMNFSPAASRTDISYEMNEMTYKTLEPFGIVARIYSDGMNRFDAVLIASRSKDSFHDPRVCFSAQAWVIEKFDADTVQTKTRGDVPVQLIQMSNQQEKQSHKLAAFFYKGPKGKFYGSTQTLKFAMMWEQFWGGDDIDGVFYRVIPTFDANLSEDEQRKRLKDFIGQWLDAAATSSNGYF